MATTITLWNDKATKKLEPTLFSKTAEELAKKIGSEDKNANKSSQLRRYFDEMVRLSTLAKASGADMNMILPQVHMLVAKVAYAKGRKLVTDSFVEMMKSGISQINDKDDLQVFANFLESFIGFYKMHHPN
jgi:CRISPR-associated protein Csm2